MKKLVLIKFLFLLCFSAMAQGNGGGFEDCECDDSSFEDLVCVLDTVSGRTVPIPLCFAECLELEQVECEDWDDGGHDDGNGGFEDCECDDNSFDNIVCVLDSMSGEIFPIPLCFAECLELEQVECDSTVIIDPWVDCDCDEPTEEDFICVLTDPELDIICPFPSLCFAECQGYTEADVVDCGEWDNGGNNGGNGNDDFEDCECSDDDLEEFVCVLDTTSGFTFPIPLCLAECFELETIECDSTVVIDPWEDCDCDEATEEDFICVLTDAELGIICPFPSLCFAECQGYSEDDIVDCDEWDHGDGNGGEFEDCECDEAGLEEIVCVFDSTFGVTIPVPLCLAECFELEVVECDSTVIIDPWEDCECESPEADELVCVLTDTVTGVICPFPSLCFAECAGYSADDVVDCGDWDGGFLECEECSEEEYAPVCVVDTATGEIFEVYNACFADCYGLTIAEDADCSSGNGGEDCECDADDFDELVCIVDTTNDMTYEIPLCLAECFGLEVIECETDSTGEEGFVDDEIGSETQIGFAGGNIVNNTLILDITIGRDALVTVNVVGLGQALRMTQEQNMSIGTHQMTLDVSAMSEGIHLIQVSDGQKTETMKMLIVR